MDCTSPVIVRGDTFPCGKCVNCRARSRQEWVFRLRMEYKSCDFGLFVTLTYDDDHLPLDGVSVRDVQLFLKRLRKSFNSRVLRYFIVSEYGDDRNTARPHYHALLFFSQHNRDYGIYDTIEKAWQNGFVQFGEIEEGSIVYCTKYCLKGSDVPEGKNKNFRLLSKMHGGVGVDYIERLHDYHLQRLDQPHQVTDGEYKAPMPRYYRNRLMKEISDDVDTKIMIQTMYMEHVNEYRKKNEEKLRLQFRKHHPEGDDHDFIIWKHQREDRKEELISKRTKKQTIL